MVVKKVVRSDFTVRGVKVLPCPTWQGASALASRLRHLPNTRHVEIMSGLLQADQKMTEAVAFDGDARLRNRSDDWGRSSRAERKTRTERAMLLSRMRIRLRGTGYCTGCRDFMV